MSAQAPRPRICISLGRHWMYRLGLDWFTYRRLIRRAGGKPFTVHHHLHNALLTDDAGIPFFDGLLLGGGIDVHPSTYAASLIERHAKPERDLFELALIQYALLHRRPILGICRGCQLLNVAFGGTLKALPPNRIHHTWRRGLQHPVAIKRNSQLHAYLGKNRLQSVRSLHREVIDTPAPNMRVAARAPDGVIEAIEYLDDDTPATWRVGVQWHPELVPWGNPDQQLMKAFIQAGKSVSNELKHG